MAMKFASEEIRMKAVHAYIDGKATAKQLGDILGYTPATICNWVRAYKNNGQTAAKPNGHRKSCFTSEELEHLSNLIEKKVDITLEEIRESFGKTCSLVAIHKIVKKLGFVYKKTLRASEQDRKDIKTQRESWSKYQKTVPVDRLIFLDESGVKTNMTRLYGRAYKGNRCYDKAPGGRWKTVTLLSSIRLDGTTESLMFEGAVDRKMFEAYIKYTLGPILRPGDVVILDNLGSHKSKTAQEIVKSKGAEYVFLPAYSPDFNPIEKMWSKIKQILRGLKARTHEELYAAVAKALSMITHDDAQGWFESCGYEKF